MNFPIKKIEAGSKAHKKLGSKFLKKLAVRKQRRLLKKEE